MTPDSAVIPFIEETNSRTGAHHVIVDGLSIEQMGHYYRNYLNNHSRSERNKY